MGKIVNWIVIATGAVVFVAGTGEELQASNQQGNPAVCRPQRNSDKFACVGNFLQRCGSKGHYSGKHNDRNWVVFYPPAQMTHCRLAATKCLPPMMVVDRGSVDPDTNPYANCANPGDSKNKQIKAGKRTLACCVPKTYLGIL